MTSKKEKKLNKFEKEITKKYKILEKEREKNSMFVIIDKKNHNKEELLRNLENTVKEHNSKRYGIFPTPDINLVQMMEGEKGYYIHTFIGNEINTSRKSGGRPTNALPPKLPRSAFRE